MVKIVSPLFSESASGSIAKNITYSKRASGQQVRFQKKQKDVSSFERTIQRDYYNKAVSAWNDLNDVEKQSWRVSAKSKHFTGYNLFIKIYIDNLVLEGQKAYYGVSIHGNFIYGNI